MALKTVKEQPKGFTLVELMVVLVILAVISIGSMTAIVGQNKVYHSEEDLIDMQMNARIAMDRICFLLRMAGVGCSDSFGSKLDDGNLATNGDVAANPLTTMFVITNNTPPTSDQLTLVGAVKHSGSISSIPADNQITLNSQNANLDGTVAAKSYIFISPYDENRYKTISAISGTTLTLTNNLDVDEKKELQDALTAGVDLDVYQVQAFTIRLVNNSLRIDDNISASSTNLDVADNIQDLQFQYGLDTDTTPDGQIDIWVDDTTDIDQIRAVRVFILAQTGNIDKEYTDRKAYTLAGVTIGPFNDNVHRFLLESTITVRNRNF